MTQRSRASGSCAGAGHLLVGKVPHANGHSIRLTLYPHEVELGCRRARQRDPETGLQTIACGLSRLS